MLQAAWGWFTTWVIGWGGVAALAAVLAWVAWWLSPAFKPQLLHLAVALTVFTVASTYFYTQGWERGYGAALAAVARADQGAVDRVNAGKSLIKACRDRGGTWDVVAGVCK